MAGTRQEQEFGQSIVSNINLSEVNDQTTAAGAGAVTAGTQRVTLASDDPAVVSLSTLDGAIATISTTEVMKVAIFDNADTQITTFGGGTQYADGAVQATPTGTVSMGTDGSNIFALTSDTDGHLQVDILSSALPSGAATAANQTTIIGYVDGIETLLTTIDSDTSILAATDFMLGTDFSTVFGTGSLLTATQADDIANTVDTVNVSAFGYAFDGITWDRMRGDSIDGLLVNLGGNNDVTLSTLPDTAGGDLASISTGMSTVAGAVAGVEMQVDVVAALPAGTNAIGKLAANSGIDIGDVDVTSISAGSNLIGDVGISGARTSGGTTIFRSLDLDETEEEIKATAGQVYWIHAMNMKASVVYLKFYNATAADVTVGTTTPVLTFPVPTLGDTNGAGFVLAVPNGIAFSTAITAAAVTGVADNSTTGPGANELILNCGYA